MCSWHYINERHVPGIKAVKLYNKNTIERGGRRNIQRERGKDDRK